MFDVRASDGRGRVADWKPSETQTMRTPGLLFPETSQCPPPAWVQAVVTTQPKGKPGVIELVSGGTWFYPNPAAENPGANLVVPAIGPAPTTQVQVISAGPELAILHDAGGWASNPKAMVETLIQARREATPGRLLWAPALGTPEDYALWTYLGIDLFDASTLLLAGIRNQVLTTDGALTAEQAGKVLGDGTTWTTEQVLAHNLEAARRELELVRHHIHQGTLRALVERRIYTKAASVETLRLFDREHHYLEAATPKFRTTPLPAMTAEALLMPEVDAFRRTFQDKYQPPQGRILVLLPCSQRKPYKTSRSHRAFIRVLEESGIRHQLHEVMVTSPLGLVPRDIEEVYPANQYDIPVTGHWLADEEEVVRTQLAALLDKKEYDHVIVHMSQHTFDMLRDLLPPDTTRHTCLHHPTSPEDLKRLGAELARLKPLIADSTPFDRKLADIRALASFQFGPEVAAALTDGNRTFGRMPYLKLETQQRVQFAMTTPERGTLSLTIEGARVLAAQGKNRVFIGDFTPKKTSSLFAVGVMNADPNVRVGDEVVVMRGDTVVASGTAAMSAEEMTHLKRGIAVTIRHFAESAASVTVAPKKEVLA